MKGRKVVCTLSGDLLASLDRLSTLRGGCPPSFIIREALSVYLPVALRAAESVRDFQATPSTTAAPSTPLAVSAPQEEDPLDDYLGSFGKDLGL